MSLQAGGAPEGAFGGFEVSWITKKWVKIRDLSTTAVTNSAICLRQG
jgi:hypothetical protein